MLLSIIITTFNRASYLNELLDILAVEVQSSFPLEIIVADNASTDDTSVVVAGAISRGLVLNYIRRPVNLRFPGNLRESLGVAKGVFVWPLCDDDLVEPGVIQKVIACLQADPTPSLYLLNRNIYDVHMKRLLRSDSLSMSGRCSMDGNALVAGLGAELLTASCVIVKREYAIIGAGRDDYDGLYCETLVIGCEALAHGRGVVLGDVYVRYREGNTGSWNIWWPVISLYNMPRVIERSELGMRDPRLVQYFVKNRGGAVMEGFCRIAMDQDRLMAGIELSRLRSYYADRPDFSLIFSMAFDLPKWVPACYFYFMAVVRLARKFYGSEQGGISMFFQASFRKFLEFRKKQIKLHS